MDKKTVILALSWRDIKAPKSGGAEVLSHAMLSRLDPQIYRVIHLSPMFPGAKKVENIDGVSYIRHGNIGSVIFYAAYYYLKNKGDIDYVIDECNTHHFFTPFYIPKEKRILFIHQLTREIWYISAKFPLNVIGHALESWSLRIYRKGKAITVSESTKQDLVSLGFDPHQIFIIPNGIHTEIKQFMEEAIPKQKSPTLIYVGRYASYKGIDIAIQAFADVNKQHDDAKLWIVGKENIEYICESLVPVLQQYQLKIYFVNSSTQEAFISRCGSFLIAESQETADIVIWGFVDEGQKYRLMKSAWLLLFPSIREGWGIIVTEAALLKTPSLVSDAPGCRDAVNYGKAGYICKERTPSAFAAEINRIMADPDEYQHIVETSFSYSLPHLWDSSVQQKAIEDLQKNVFISKSEFANHE